MTLAPSVFWFDALENGGSGSLQRCRRRWCHYFLDFHNASMIRKSAMLPISGGFYWRRWVWTYLFSFCLRPWQLINIFVSLFQFQFYFYFDDPYVILGFWFCALDSSGGACPRCLPRLLFWNSVTCARLETTCWNPESPGDHMLESKVLASGVLDFFFLSTTMTVCARSETTCWNPKSPETTYWNPRSCLAYDGLFN